MENDNKADQQSTQENNDDGTETSVIKKNENANDYDHSNNDTVKNIHSVIELLSKEDVALRCRILHEINTKLMRDTKDFSYLDHLIDSNILPTIIGLLNKKEDFLTPTHLREQDLVTWILINVAGGSSRHVSAVTELIPPMIRLLSSNYKILRSNALWFMRNVAVDKIYVQQVIDELHYNQLFVFVSATIAQSVDSQTIVDAGNALQILNEWIVSIRTTDYDLVLTKYLPHFATALKHWREYNPKNLDHDYKRALLSCIRSCTVISSEFDDLMVDAFVDLKLIPCLLRILVLVDAPVLQVLILRSFANLSSVNAGAQAIENSGVIKFIPPLLKLNSNKKKHFPNINLTNEKKQRQNMETEETQNRQPETEEKKEKEEKEENKEKKEREEKEDKQVIPNDDVCHFAAWLLVNLVDEFPELIPDFIYDDVLHSLVLLFIHNPEKHKQSAGEVLRVVCATPLYSVLLYMASNFLVEKIAKVQHQCAQAILEAFLESVEQLHSENNDIHPFIKILEVMARHETFTNLNDRSLELLASIIPLPVFVFATAPTKIQPLFFLKTQKTKKQEKQKKQKNKKTKKNSETTKRVIYFFFMRKYPR